MDKLDKRLVAHKEIVIEMFHIGDPVPWIAVVQHGLEHVLQPATYLVHLDAIVPTWVGRLPKWTR